MSHTLQRPGSAYHPPVPTSGEADHLEMHRVVSPQIPTNAPVRASSQYSSATSVQLHPDLAPRHRGGQHPAEIEEDEAQLIEIELNQVEWVRSLPFCA